ncbi:MAG TPA: ARMT1-like domain-containing protein [Gammaproteobacteria bacterium]
MLTQPECQHCFLRQALDAARRAGLDASASAALQMRVRLELATMAASMTPPERASRIHALVREVSGNQDPYRLAKQEATAHALALYPQLKQRIAHAADPIELAVRIAIAGNIIDLGVASEYDLEASIAQVLTQPLAIDHLARLKQAAREAGELLFLADNAGETVMDRLLIETLAKPTTYVVKGGAAVNDATRDDARAAGLDAVCTVIDNGAAILGTLFEQCRPELKQRFDRAPLIIAKGMANYESLHGSRQGLFFLLQSKCAVVAAHLGVAERSLIVMEDNPCQASA